MKLNDKNILTLWLQRIGLSTLRRRYVAVILVISAALSILAYFAWYKVDNLTSSQLQEIEHRARADNELANVILQLHRLETVLQRFILQPNDENKKSINRAFLLHDSAINKLRGNAWIRQEHARLDILRHIETDRGKLFNEIESLIKVRLDGTHSFPAINIMRERMFRHHNQFLASLNYLIMEVSENLSKPANLGLYQNLIEIRYTWQSLVSEFRLLVAYSLGMFSHNPQRDIRPHKTNIELGINRLQLLIDKLNKYQKQHQSPLLNDKSLTDIQQQFTDWNNAYAEVTTTFNPGQWRHDIVLLQKNIDPVFEHIRAHTSNLERELDIASTQNITDLTIVAHNLSDSIIIIVVCIILSGLLGFIVFNKAILTPIAQVATALKDEAMGKQKTEVPLSTALEIQQLSDAFYEMQRQIRNRQAHLDHMAHHDALTQLPNRLLFHDRLEQAIFRAERDATIVGLLFLDLDRFKKINDTLGHDIGDRLLKIASSRLTSTLRSTDTVARLGGDEFAIIAENINSTEQLSAMAGKVLSAFITPFQIENYELHVSVSIGITTGPGDEKNVDALIKNADIAMYYAKDAGRNNYKFYSSEMASQVASHLTLETQLRHALDNNEFELYYQPIINLKTGSMISTEALLRWNHPTRGLLLPGEFLPILEDSGMIRSITQWVINQASQQYLRNKKTGLNVRMSVNLSGLLLKDDTIMDVIINAITYAKMEPAGLIVEITEDTLLEDLQGSLKALNTLQSMGIRIALDDFGTGQSSLNHLRQSPIDIVKIDKDFVRDIPSDRQDSELVDAIIAMAHKLHIKVVAEGVETRQQLDFLRWHKCDAIQGYLFSPPLSSHELDEMLTQDKHMSI